MAFFRKVQASLVKNEITDFVGEVGNIFFNIDTGELRLSDGITPGGLPIYSNGIGGNQVSIAILGSVATAADLSPAYVGAPGDTFIARDTGNLYMWDGTVWLDLGPVLGPQGYTGSRGFLGSQGDVGFTGSRGLDGYAGSVGYTGSFGNTGFTGSKGLQGEVGFTGSKGEFGLQGIQGEMGYTGYTGSVGGIGYTGSQGFVGFAGSRGDIGYTGSQGIQGEVGFAGSQGVIGYTGSQGDVGFVGSQGDIGYTGSQGIQGDIGYTGSQGVVGYTGSLGLSAYDIAVNNGFVGTEQQWLDTLGDALTVEPNTGLEISNNVITTSYNSLISDDVQSISVGGAAAQSASVWKSKNIVEVLDTILFPDVAPTYTNPTLSLTGSQSGIREIGSTVSQSLVLTAVENDAGIVSLLTLIRDATQVASSVNPTGTAATAIAAQFGYTDPNNPNFSYSLSYTDAVTVINGNINWNGSSTYAAGLPKKNNKGVTDTRTAAVRSTAAPQAASSMSGSAITVSGIYPFFWGKSSTQPTAASIATAIRAGTTNKVLTAASGTITVTFNAVAEYVWVAHVASYTVKTKWFNTELNQGNIGAGNFILSPVSQSVNSPDLYWSNINFSVYISDGATTTNGALQFRNS
jgi:hypothetical protein